MEQHTNLNMELEELEELEEGELVEEGEEAMEGEKKGEESDTTECDTKARERRWKTKRNQKKKIRRRNKMRRMLLSLFGGPVKEIPQINPNPRRSNHNKSFGVDRVEVTNKIIEVQQREIANLLHYKEIYEEIYEEFSTDFPIQMHEKMREEFDRKMKRTPRELVQTFMINRRNRHINDTKQPSEPAWSDSPASVLRRQTRPCPVVAS